MAEEKYTFQSFSKKEESKNVSEQVDQDFTDYQEDSERDYRPIRQNRQGRTGCMGGIMYFLFVVSISVIIACLTWMAASDVLALNKDDKTAVVTLPTDIFEKTTDEDGKSVSKCDINYVAKELKNEGIIEYKGLFKLFCSLSHAATQLDPGSYEMKTTYDYRAIVKKMQTGSNAMLTTEVTIPEGYTMAQMFKTLEENDVCDFDSLMDAAANVDFQYDFVDPNKKGDPTRLEGYLFPDTYQFYTGMEPASAVDVFLSNFRERMTAEILQKADESGYALAGIIKVASMIEKEAANDNERAIIASVIYNRINAGMPIQIDSTILYLYQDHEGAPTQDMLDSDSPYNTRLKTGLPPTAICNPGMASIRAALNPSDTDYYFYALDTETGTHRFFTTASEFNAFVATQQY